MSDEVKKEDIELIKKTLEKISQSVDRLERTLIGDKTFGIIGLIERIEEIEEYVERGKAERNKVIGAFVILTALQGLLLKFWDKIF
jgi:hypothetical protein